MHKKNYFLNPNHISVTLKSREMCSICTNVSVGAQNTLAPVFELDSQIILCVVLDRMLLRHLKTQHAQMNHGLQSMRQFALTKMYIDQYYDQP